MKDVGVKPALTAEEPDRGPSASSPAMKRKPDIKARIRKEGEKPPRRHKLVRPESYPSTPGLKRYEADKKAGRHGLILNACNISDLEFGVTRWGEPRTMVVCDRCGSKRCERLNGAKSCLLVRYTS